MPRASNIIVPASHCILLIVINSFLLSTVHASVAWMDPMILQQCCRMGKRSHEAALASPSSSSSPSTLSMSSKNSSLVTGSPFFQAKCHLPSDSNLIPLEYSPDVQHQCQLSFRICCRRHSEYRACEYGKVRAFNADQSCKLINPTSPSSVHTTSWANASSIDLMEVASVCCTLCRSLGKSHKSVIPCTSAARHQLLQQFGSDLSDCCPSPSANEGKLKVILDDTDDPLPIVRSGRAREDVFDSLTVLKLSNYTCANGSGKGCVCSEGFKLNGDRCIDINECQLGIHRCPIDHRCDNTIGSFICVREATCGTGYTWNHDLKECEDNDECTTSPLSPCPSGYICRNTRGSFRCDKEDQGHVVSPNDTSLSPRTWKHGLIKLTSSKHCATGFTPSINSPSSSMSNCIDIDECTLGSHSCRALQTCVNTIGSYSCLDPCPPGYIRRNSVNANSSSSSTVPAAIKSRSDCDDIDECTEGGHTCRSDQKCINLPGAYRCICPNGYILGVNRTCMDIDECSTGHSCDEASQVCINLPGSYECRCRFGFQSINGKCVDVNECQSRSDPCQGKGYHNSSICLNTQGSYRCICNGGFVMALNGTCVDIDECSSGQEKCPSGLPCINTLGSYVCTCPAGYKGELSDIGPMERWSRRSKASNDKVSCSDIDECSHGDPCASHSSNSICVNTLGSYQCIKIDCETLGHGFTADPSNRNRCKRLYTCPTGTGGGGGGSSGTGSDGDTSSHLIGVKGHKTSDSATCQEIHAYTFLSLPSNVTIPEISSRLELIALRTVKSANCLLEVTNATVTDASAFIPFSERVAVTTRATSERSRFFSLIHQDSVVRISLTRSILGPQSIILRVSCSSPSDSLHKVTQVTTDILITVSQHPF